MCCIEHVNVTDHSLVAISSSRARLAHSCWMWLCGTNKQSCNIARYELYPQGTSRCIVLPYGWIHAESRPTASATSTHRRGRYACRRSERAHSSCLRRTPCAAWSRSPWWAVRLFQNRKRTLHIDLISRNVIYSKQKCPLFTCDKEALYWVGNTYRIP